MKIEFDETNATVARAMGRALLEIAGEKPNKIEVPRTVQCGGMRETVTEAHSYAQEGTQAHKEYEEALAGDKPHGPEKHEGEVGMVPELGAGYEGWQNKEPVPPGGALADCCPSHDESHLGTTLAHEVIQQVADSLRVDQHGVPFDDRYCGEAEEPFYTSGKMRGQWKKRRGVEEPEYLSWYEAQRPVPAPAEPAPLPFQGVAAAFGAPIEPAAAKPLPANAGELMAWAAELQAAGRLIQADITAAYAEQGLSLLDIFESAAVPPALAQERIGKLHALLSAKAGV